MKTWRASSSGSSSSNPSSSFIGASSQLAGPATVGEHEVDGRSDGEDRGGLLVGDAHAVGVLELLHERVEVERVRREILLEARLGRDRRRDRRRARRRDGRGSARRPARRSLSGQASVRCGWRWRRRARGAARRRASSAAWVRADDVLARTALGAQDRLREAVAGEAPVGHDAEPAQPEQVGAALRSGSISSRKARSAGAAAGPPSCARGEASAAARIDAQHRLRDALDQLQRDVAGEAVGDDHVGDAAR